MPLNKFLQSMFTVILIFVWISKKNLIIIEVNFRVLKNKISKMKLVMKQELNIDILIMNMMLKAFIKIRLMKLKKRWIQR